MGRTKIESFTDLFVFELKDLYSAESQLIEALPKMAEAAASEQLAEAFRTHLEETKQQKERLERISEILDVDLEGEKCEAMKGLIEEGEEVIKSEAPDSLRDAALVAAAQRVEHYEIAGYGTAVHFAQILQEEEVSEILSEILEEEKAADLKLNRVAKQNVNVKAEKVH